MSDTESPNGLSSSRPQIDQVKSVLRAALGIESDAVVEALLRVSQHADVALSTVAQWLVDNAATVDSA